MILNGRSLSERRTLRFYNYNEGDILYLEDKKIMIHVQLSDGQLASTEAKPDESILKLKEKLIEDGIIDSKGSKLFFNGSELKFKYKTLKQLNIQQNSKLYAF